MGDMHDLSLLTSVKCNIPKTADVCDWMVAAGSSEIFVTVYKDTRHQLTRRQQSS
jgi:hypothetical protein